MLNLWAFGVSFQKIKHFGARMHEMNDNNDILSFRVQLLYTCAREVPGYVSLMGAYDTKKAPRHDVEGLALFQAPGYPLAALSFSKVRSACSLTETLIYSL